MIFNCFELNIILQNLTTDNREEFIERLLSLKENTEAIVLINSIESLLDKISRCSDADMKLLHIEVNNHRINPMEMYVL